MATRYDNVIVFGPTGAVGSAVALEASRRGAKVWLAMRDTTKPIPGMTKEQQQQGSFERVQADLSDSASVKQAVRQSGAKAAFFYRIRAQDGMRSTLEAMKETGIEYVVFMSSYTIGPQDDPRKIMPEEVIPYMHAQVEIILEEIGLAGTMLRGGSFASNLFWQSLNRTKEPWEAVIPISAQKEDCIVPADIGRVGGAVLVNRPSMNATEVIYLLGPQLLTRTEQLDIIGKLSGKKIRVQNQSGEEHRQYLLGNGFPVPIVTYLLNHFDSNEHEETYPEPHYSNSVANIKKYSGYEPTSFEDFVATQLT